MKMIRSGNIWILSMGCILATMLMFALSVPADAKKNKRPQLTSIRTTAAITLDAKAEAAWDKAKAMEVTVDQTPYKPSNGYKGMKETKVSIKSIYDREYIYFLIQYRDPTKSIERFPWVKQKNGSWKQLSNKDSTGHDNTYYEDKLGVYWNINTRGFAKKGCDISCHVSEDGKVDGRPDKSAGRKFTRRSGETIDMWHWKSVRSNPVGMFDDQFVDHTRDPKQNKNWGRKGDHKLGGGYKNNSNKAKTAPEFVNKPGSEKNKYWLMLESKAKFVDTFKPGSVVPGIILSPFKGSRGDIQARGMWADGTWTIEVKRKLVTTGEKAEIQDVQFKDLGKAYYFGVSVFDNSQINHLFHSGSLELRFK